MACRRASQLISESMDRPLTVIERFSLRFHLLVCGLCRRYQRQLLLLRHAMRAAFPVDDADLDVEDELPNATLSPEARQRIREAIGRLQ